MEVQRKAPTQVNYQDVLPLAIPSSSNRREFLPVNGSAFTPNGSNIIRIDVNADSMLDTQHSYLQFTLANSTAANTLLPDVGVPWVQRLVISSGGVTLEDINEYGKLYALLQTAQNSTSKQLCENALIAGGTNNLSTALAGDVAVPAVQFSRRYPELTAGAALTPTNVQNQIVGATSKTMCVPLFSGLLNCEKYIPLILMNAGITIELTLGVEASVGISEVTAGGAAAANTYSITDCRYVAHLVDMDRAFYDALRSEMAMTGSIAIHGQTWRHFRGNVGVGATTGTINIPARMKSIKSIFSVFRYVTDTDGTDSYQTSALQYPQLSQWQYQIGSVFYPQAAVNVSVTNIATTACELLKAFGKLGDAVADCSISPQSFILPNAAAGGGAVAGANIPQFIVGYDLEAFQRSALESGIDTANRALPINLQLQFSAGAPAGGIAVDNYVVADAFFYVNTDGTATPST